MERRRKERIVEMMEGEAFKVLSSLHLPSSPSERKTSRCSVCGKQKFKLEVGNEGDFA